jgi:hypothetical protein
MPLPGMPPPGRFPDLANIPTVIAAGEPPPDLVNTAAGMPVASGFANQPTDVATPPAGAVPPALVAFANAPTALAPSSHAENATQVAPMPVPPNGPPAPEPPGNGGRSQPWHPRPQVSSSSPPVHPAPPSAGYPVMNAQLSAQIATGATVFPSEARPSPGHGVPVVPVGPAGPAAPRMLDPGDGDSAHAAMAGMPGIHDPGARISDPQHAANLMSPVGQQYPDRDWGAAAASRARAVPPWLLAVLFIGTLAVALTLTILIAKLVR